MKKTGSKKERNNYFRCTLFWGAIAYLVIIIVFYAINCILKKHGIKWLDGNAWVSIIIGALGAIATVVLGIIAITQNTLQRRDNNKNTQTQLKIIKNQYIQTKNAELKLRLLNCLKSFNFSVFLSLSLSDDNEKFDAISSNAYVVLNTTKLELEGSIGFCSDIKQCVKCQTLCSVRNNYSKEVFALLQEYKDLYYDMIEKYLDTIYRDCFNYFVSTQNEKNYNTQINLLNSIRTKLATIISESKSIKDIDMFYVELETVKNDLKKAKISFDEEKAKCESYLNEIKNKNKELEKDFLSLQLLTNKIVLNVENEIDQDFNKIIKNVLDKKENKTNG